MEKRLHEYVKELEEKVKELEQLCKPIADYLKNNWDLHCSVIITYNHIKLVRNEIGIPVKNDG